YPSFFLVPQYILQCQFWLPSNPQQVTQSVDVCIEDEIVNYLNRNDVQKALHARLVGVNRWTICSSILDYDVLNEEIPTINVVG
ncbi:hypothetical protein IFM89_023381, partial [Coptis chinensis]